LASYLDVNPYHSPRTVPGKSPTNEELETNGLRNEKLNASYKSSYPKLPTSYELYNVIGSSETQTKYTQMKKLEADGLKQSMDDSLKIRYLPPKYNMVNETPN